MFPFLVCLFDLENVSEKATVDFWKLNLVVDYSFNPVLFILKWKIKDKSTALRQVLLKLIVNQVEHILLLNRLSQVKIFNNTLLNGCQSTNHIAILIGFRWILFKELDSLENLVNNTFDTDVHKIKLFGSCSGQSGLARFGSTNNHKLKGLLTSVFDDVIREGVGVIMRKGHMLGNEGFNESVDIF